MRVFWRLKRCSLVPVRVGPPVICVTHVPPLNSKRTVYQVSLCILKSDFASTSSSSSGIFELSSLINSSPCFVEATSRITCPVPVLAEPSFVPKCAALIVPEILNESWMIPSLIGTMIEELGVPPMCFVLPAFLRFSRNSSDEGFPTKTPSMTSHRVPCAATHSEGTEPSEKSAEKMRAPFSHIIGESEEASTRALLSDRDRRVSRIFIVLASSFVRVLVDRIARFSVSW